MDPFEGLEEMMGGGFEDDSDPFSSLDNDPFSGIEQLALGFRKKPDERNIVSRVAGNLVGDVGEMVDGVSKMIGAGVRTGVDLFKIPFNIATQDPQEATEAWERIKGVPSTIWEGVESEIDRVKEIYGPALRGDFGPLKESAIEDPLFTAMDAAAVADIAAAPVRIGGAVAKGSARRAVSDRFLRVPGEVRGLADQRGGFPSFLRTQTPEHRPDPRAAFEAGDAASAARAEVLNNQAYGATTAERMESLKRLELILGPHADMMQFGTVLDNVSHKVRDSNPFRLAWSTIGAMPPVKRLRELSRNVSEAVGTVALNERRWAPFARKEMKETQAALDIWNAGDDIDKQVAFSFVTELNPENTSLTSMQRGMANSLKTLRRFSGSLSDVGFDEGRQGALIKASAIEIETRKRPPSRTGTLTLDEARGLLDLDFNQEMTKLDAQFKRVSARLTALRKEESLLKGDMDLTELRQAERDYSAIIENKARLAEQKQLVELANDRYKAGELAYIPGKDIDANIADLDPVLFDTEVVRNAKTGDVSDPSTHYLSRRTSANANPMTVEEAFLEYTQALSIMIGRQALREDVGRLAVRLDAESLKQVARGFTVVNQEGKKWDAITIDGEKMALPQGMLRVFEDKLGRRGKNAADPALKAIDFTRGEFSKVVLGLSPRWLTYNLIGGSALYALGAGSPVAFAKAAGMKMSDGLEKWLTKHEWNVPKMVQRGAKEWREMIPESYVQGFASYELFRPQYPEFASKAERTWGKWSIQHMAEKYRGFTDKLTDLAQIGKINEAVEEIYRGAMWMTEAKRTARARNFVDTGNMVMALDSEQARARMKRMADELRPLERTSASRGRFQLSQDTRNVMDMGNKFMNDYYRLGPIERSVFRRVFPFWSWMKFMNKLAVDLPMQHPIRVAVGAHMSNVFNDVYAVEGFKGEHIPKFLRQLIPVKKHPDGTMTFQNGEGGNPFRGIVFQGEGLDWKPDEGLKQLASGINPVLMVPLQWATGFSAWRGGPFRVAPSRASSDGIVRPYGSEEAYKITATGAEEITPRPSIPLALARGGLIPIPMFQTIEKTVRGGAHDDVGSIHELGFELGRIIAGHPKLDFAIPNQLEKLVGDEREFPGAFTDKNGQPFGAQETSRELFSGLGLRTNRFRVEEVIERERQRREYARKQFERNLRRDE